MTAGQCTPEARSTLQRVLFKNGRASISAFQRHNRISWDEARDLLIMLAAGGWLDGLELSPHLRPAAVPTPAITRPGCYNRSRPSPGSTYIAQDGWREYKERGLPVRVPVWVEVPFRMEVACQTDMTTRGCAGCGNAPGSAA